MMLATHYSTATFFTLPSLYFTIFNPTGIDKTTTSTDVEEVSRYSLNGQLLVGPTKGLNIVKYSDGSVKKVAVE